MYKQITKLDSLTCPLQGRVVIEAAAGTGKTYNIQNLVARLLLEKGYAIDEIVVVTFTNAATAELKMRIRKILTDLAAVLEGKSNTEAQAETLVEAIRKQQVPDDIMLKRVRSALRDFDLAAISTIDGFVQRINSEFAVENGVRFAVTPVENNEEKIGELCSIYHRRQCYSFEKSRTQNLYPLICSQNGCDEKMLAKIAGKLDENPALILDQFAPPTAESINDIINEMEEIICNFRDFRIGCNYEQLQRAVDKCKKNLKEAKHRQSFLDDAWIQSEDEDLPADCLQKMIDIANSFSASYNAKGKDKTNDYPDDLKFIETDLNDIVQELPDLLKAFRNFYIDNGLREVMEKLAVYRSTRGVWSYANSQNHLLESLHNDTNLRQTLSRRYKTVIIDEFQDTNAVQYGIFDAIFGDDERPFFMVGDPRQAIYSFRGGDLNAYLKARQTAAQHGDIYTLTDNFRSSGDILMQIGRLFTGNSFANEGISIGPIKAGGTNSELHFYRGQEAQTSPLYVEDLEGIDGREMPQRIVSLVRELLSGKYSIGTDTARKQVQAEDIAILCISNMNATIILNALAEAGIAAFHSRNVNIFSTREADEMLDFLNGVINFDQREAICKALHSSICHCSVNALHEINIHPEKYAEEQERFRRFYELWMNKSFAALFTCAMDTFGSAQYLASTVNAERSLVNFYQLADLIQAEESRRRLTPEATLKAVEHLICDAQKNDNKTPPDGFEQQLASNKGAVTLMTIHHSKGLEFPVVILPDFDVKVEVEQKSLIASTKAMNCFHRDDKIHFDVGQQALTENQLIYAQETLQEKLRVLYVGVTRAKYAAYIMRKEEKKPKGGEAVMKVNPLLWLLDGTCDTPAIAPARWHNDDEKQNINTFTCPQNSGYTAVTAVQPNADLTPPQEINVKFDDSWSIASYSALVKHGDKRPADFLRESLNPLREDENDDGENGDIPETAKDNEAELPPSFFFPAGDAMGTMLHSTLEHFDFTLTPGTEEFEDAVRSAFAWRFPEESKAFKGLHYMMEQLASVTFNCHPEKPFKLAELTGDCCRRELEFHFSLGNNFDWTQFLQILGQEDNSEGTVKKLCLNRGSIFNGIIDMIFIHGEKIYILDWKSDRMGGILQSFLPENLETAIRNAGYDVQYYIYLAAVIRYMEQRLQRPFDREMYERHFGGAYYVFIRGVREGSRNGIYFQRPDYESMEKIRSIFSGC